MVSRGSMNHAAGFHFSDSFKLFEEAQTRERRSLEQKSYQLKLESRTHKKKKKSMSCSSRSDSTLHPA